eukprot:symbB.v1.2.042508.t1/scaffold10239.1/size1825/1
MERLICREMFVAELHEATSRGSESKDPKEEAEETRAGLTDVEDRDEVDDSAQKDKRRRKKKDRNI